MKTPNNTISYLKRLGVILMLPAITVSLSACSDEETTNVDVQKIVGGYSVADTDEFDEVENYSISITKSSGGGANIEISNFGDIMFVPVKANINGTNFTVPSQTFVGKTLTIEISGSGSFNGVDLVFNYSIDTGDAIILEHNCVATKR